jgi:hypothetical protein
LELTTNILVVKTVSSTTSSKAIHSHTMLISWMIWKERNAVVFSAISPLRLPFLRYFRVRRGFESPRGRSIFGVVILVEKSLAVYLVFLFCHNFFS